ncbi:MAG: LysR family transcriptional regulator [Arenicella sp.]
MDKLNAIQILIASVESGSFTKAAEKLGTSPSTISKAISRLEQELGISLLKRTTRKLLPTDLCLEYLRIAKPLISQLDEVENRLNQSTVIPEGKLKISLPIAYGRQMVLPLLPHFSKRYPNIDLDISWTDHYSDIVGENIDIAIRSGSIHDGQLVARKLSPLDFVTCVSQEYLATHANIQDIEDLQKEKWLVFRFNNTGKLMPILCDANGQKKFHPHNKIIGNDGEALAEMAAHGMGIIQLPHFIVHQWVKKKQLHVIGPIIRSNDFSIYIYYLNKQFLPLKVRVFIDFISEELANKNETTTTTWTDFINV